LNMKALLVGHLRGMVRWLTILVILPSSLRPRVHHVEVFPPCGKWMRKFGMPFGASVHLRRWRSSCGVLCTTVCRVECISYEVISQLMAPVFVFLQKDGKYWPCNAVFHFPQDVFREIKQHILLKLAWKDFYLRG
jgi:hypothetical protein